SLILKILEQSSFSGVEELTAQVANARVTGGLPMSLDLAVEEGAPPANRRDGPIPVRALAKDEDHTLLGEVLIWVKGGYLRAIEFGWLTDEMPKVMPSAGRVEVEPDEARGD